VKTGSILLVLAALLCGCSSTSRGEYKDATNEAAQAIKTDVGTAVHATKAAGKAVRGSIDKANDKPSSN
jgi:hypothetical protein